MKKFLWILTLLTLIMTACTRQTQTPTEPVLEVGLPADEPPVEADLPTATVTEASTSTPSPTKTTSPTETLSPTNSPTPRPSHTPTTDPEQYILATVVAQSEPVGLFNSESPDGSWRAEGLRYECTLIEDGEYAGLEIAYEEIILTDQSDGKEIMIDSQQQFCGGLGAFGLGGLYWAPNSRYFYYTTAREGVPDGCGWAWQQPVLRYDVSETETASLGAGFISPDGLKLAAWDRQSSELVVWTLDGAETGRVPAATEDAVGPVVWSPDSQALVTLQVENYCPFLSGKSYLVFFDLATRESETLLVSELPTFGGVSWEKPGELHLEDGEGKTWRFDLGTRKLDPTPLP